MSGVNKLLKNTLIFGISNFASKILVFMLLPLYTRVLTTTDFGSGDLINSIISLIIPILTLSVAEGALRFAISKNSDTKAVFTYGIIIIFSGFIFLILLIPIINQIPILMDFKILFYLIYITKALNNYCNRFVRGINKIKLVGVVGVLSTIVLLLSNIVFLVIFKLGIYGYLISYLLMNLISMIVLFWGGGLYKYIDTKNINIKLVSEINQFNIPLIPNRISWIIISTFNKYSIAFFLGTGIVGIFSAANKIPSFITVIYGIVQQALLLVVIEEYEDKKESRTFYKTYQILSTVLLFSVIIINSLIKPLSLFLFSNEFYEAYKIAPLLVIASFFGALHGNLTTHFSAIKKTKILFQNSIIGMLLMVFLSTLLVPRLGLIGAGIASVIVYFLMWGRLFNKVKSFILLENKIQNDIICYLLVFLHWIILINIDTNLYYFLTLIITSVIIFLKRKLIKIIYKITISKCKELLKYLNERKRK